MVQKTKKIEPAVPTRFAVLYSDGSLGVLVEGATLEQAKEQREETDVGETDPEHLTKVVSVRCELLEVLFEPAPLPQTFDEVRRLRAEVAALQAQLRSQTV